MKKVYELVCRREVWNWNPIEGDILPDWAQNREPDYPNLEILSTDQLPYPRFASMVAPRIQQGYQAILQISTDHADIWERVRPT